MREYLIKISSDIQCYDCEVNHPLVDALALGETIREARRQIGLSQEGLARRIGVARMTVSRLERGEEVSMSTALDGLNACGLTLATTTARGWRTAAEHARDVGEELVGGDHDFALRLVRQALEDLAFLQDNTDAAGLREFLAEAPSTGDERWDRFMTIAIRTFCDRHGMALPSWSGTAPMSEPFFPARPGRRFMARTVERTQPDFGKANIWIDDHDLSYA
ncbi:MAG: helix-turn-helix transcriptional regulator [Nocardioidaceae bacterium]|nr:helix-turn-helix transcriptional regulator [Nocardioidaceae bacterium]